MLLPIPINGYASTESSGEGEQTITIDDQNVLQACATTLAGVLIFITIERKLETREGTKSQLLSLHEEAKNTQKQLYKLQDEVKNSVPRDWDEIKAKLHQKNDELVSILDKIESTRN